MERYFTKRVRIEYAVGLTNEDPPATMQHNTSEHNLEMTNDTYNSIMTCEILLEIHQQQTMGISDSSLTNDEVNGERTVNSAISIELESPYQLGTETVSI